MKKCLDEAIIQAYLDGELSQESAHAAAAHLAQCGACAAALDAAATDNAFFAASFAPDANLNVPTEILRARINAEVARLESAPAADARPAPGLNFGALAARLSGLFSFTPQRAAAFASVLAVVAFAVFFLVVRRQTTPTINTPSELAQLEAPSSSPQPVAPADGDDEVEARVSESRPPAVASNRPTVLKASATRRRVARRPAKASPGALTPEVARVVPGEKNYEEAIVSLERAVKAGGDAVLNQSARIEYERNIAVLDRAIEETRRVALRNPKDKDAVSFLMSAYQSKVELLTTVADQAQVAAIGR